jgi:hypothetical protein
MKRHYEPAAVAQFPQWPGCLPEMQGEVAQRLDIYSRNMLARTCKQHYQTWGDGGLFHHKRPKNVSAMAAIGWLADERYIDLYYHVFVPKKAPSPCLDLPWI